MIYGIEFFEKLIFHIMMYELNKLCSLKPDLMDLGKFEKYWTKDFETFWRYIFYKIWGY